MKRTTAIVITIALLLISATICCVSCKRHKLDDEAKAMLLDIYELEHSYKRMFGTFSNSTHALAFIQDTLITEGGAAYYYVMIENADDSSFLIKARSVIDFDNDGLYSEWQINEKRELIEVITD